MKLTASMEASGRFQELGCRAADAQRRRAALARLLRLGISDGAKSSSGEMAATSELETELALLREENAQLKVERHRPADVGHVIERMRSLRLQAPAGEPVPAAEAAHAIAVREGLLEACEEVQQAMRGIRARLSALAGDIHSRPADRAPSERLGAPAAESSEVAGSASDLARSVA